LPQFAWIGVESVDGAVVRDAVFLNFGPMAPHPGAEVRFVRAHLESDELEDTVFSGLLKR